MKGRLNMALSDQLTKLAARAKELEEHAAAAQAKARSELEQDVQRARDSAEAQGDALRASAEDSKRGVSSWWDGVQQSWNEHMSVARQNLRDAENAVDVKTAQMDADQADDDAAFAIDFAYSAIDEAEYAVLDAILAHKNLDELINA
jgi:hypothetical protein